MRAWLQPLLRAGITPSAHQGRREVLRLRNEIMLTPIVIVSIMTLVYVVVTDHPVVPYGASALALSVIGALVGLFLHRKKMYLGHVAYALFSWVSLPSAAVVHGGASGFVFSALVAPVTGSISVGSRRLNTSALLFVVLGTAATCWLVWGG